jgi:hypothetical protein
MPKTGKHTPFSQQRLPKGRQVLILPEVTTFLGAPWFGENRQIPGKNKR